MRIAVCSLSQLTYVAEILEVARELAIKNDVCYFLGYFSGPSIELLKRSGITYDIVGHPGSLAEYSRCYSPQDSVYDIFAHRFIKYAALTLPCLIPKLRNWQPDIILSNTRDFAGVIASKMLGIPLVSFGHHSSPVRVEDVDPPFGAGISKDSPKRLRRLMWGMHRAFDSRIDLLFNETLRQPYGLEDISGASTLHSTELLILCSLTIFNNKNTHDPSYVKHVGPIFSKDLGPSPDEEYLVLERIASSPRPRVFMYLSTYHKPVVIQRCLRALSGIDGTLILPHLGPSVNIPNMGPPRATNIIQYSYFYRFLDMLKLVDAVVAAGSKTFYPTLAAGRPLICLPQQGEQYELACQIRDLGAAEMPCRKRWDSDELIATTKRIVSDPKYVVAAATIKEQIENAGGARLACKLIEDQFCRPMHSC